MNYLFTYIYKKLYVCLKRPCMYSGRLTVFLSQNAKYFNVRSYCMYISQIFVCVYGEILWAFMIFSRAFVCVYVSQLLSFLCIQNVAILYFQICDVFCSL